MATGEWGRAVRQTGAMLAVAGLITLAGCTRDSDDPSDPPGTPTAEPAVELPPTTVPRPVLDDLSSEVTSGRDARVVDVVEVAPGQRLDPAFVARMAELDLEFQPATAVSMGDQQVRIDAEVTDRSGASTTWYVVLDEVDGRYLISTTEEKP